MKHLFTLGPNKRYNNNLKYPEAYHCKFLKFVTKKITEAETRATNIATEKIVVDFTPKQGRNAWSRTDVSLMVTLTSSSE